MFCKKSMVAHSYRATTLVAPATQQMRLRRNVALLCRLAVIAALFIRLGVPVSAAALPATLVARSDTPAPSGGNYQSFFWSPVINNAGQIAFQVSLKQGTSNSAIVSGFPNALATVALQSTIAPAGGQYDTLNHPNTPVINSVGQVAYYADLEFGSSSYGIFTGAPGAVQAYALEGMASPTGGPYFNLYDPTMNSSGRLAFFSILNGGFNPRGIFTGLPGSIQAVALERQAAPAGGNYSFLGELPVINASGNVAFLSDLTGGTANKGIFVGTPGSVQTVALQGTIAPAGGTYSGFGHPVINAAGQVAYIGQLTGGAAARGIFSGYPGNIQAVAVEVTAAPSGGNFLQVSNPVINKSGNVAFQSTLSGGSSSSGIFAGSFGSLQTIVLQGQTAPDGVGNFSTPSTTVAMNSSGQIAFTSFLNGPGVTTANDRGLYVSSGGNLIQIVREGDIIDVDPGPGIDNRTVGTIFFSENSGGEDGRRVGLNDSGWLVYGLGFTGGTGGIFMTQIEVVPEPGILGLLVAGFFGVAAFRRQRGSAKNRSSLETMTEEKIS